MSKVSVYWRVVSTMAHQLDGLLRRYRPLLSLQCYRNYIRWVSTQKREIPDSTPLVIFDFGNNRIDGPQGRRFYALFIFFIRAGYYPLINQQYLFLANIHQRHKKYCLKEAFSLVSPTLKIIPNYILVTDRKKSNFAENATKIFYIDYKSGYREVEGTFPMPFPMFSAIYANGQDRLIEKFRAEKKRCQIFFGGETRYEKYDKSTIRDIYKKIPRGQVLQNLRNKFQFDNWFEPKNQNELDLMMGQFIDGIFLVNTQHCKIPEDQWLSMMASSRFYLACPGVRYPMSHNSVEALAVGSVPIIQYPELFFPPLEDGKNCLVYTNENDLLVVVQNALDMEEDTRNILSKGAIAYYDQYLSPVSTVTRLLMQPQHKVSVSLLPFLKEGGGFA